MEPLAVVDPEGGCRGRAGRRRAPVMLGATRAAVPVGRAPALALAAAFTVAKTPAKGDAAGDHRATRSMPLESDRAPVAVTLGATLDADPLQADGAGGRRRRTGRCRRRRPKPVSEPAALVTTVARPTGSVRQRRRCATGGPGQGIVRRSPWRQRRRDGAGECDGRSDVPDAGDDAGENVAPVAFRATGSLRQSAPGRRRRSQLLSRGRRSRWRDRSAAVGEAAALDDP